MFENKIQEIKEKFQYLKEIDSHFLVFGSKSHEYKLGKVLTEEEISFFESNYQINLPEDYREFLLKVGNGGAGYAYGFRDLAEAILWNFKQNFTDPFIDKNELHNLAIERRANAIENNRQKLLELHGKELRDFYKDIDIDSLETIELFKMALELLQEEIGEKNHFFDTYYFSYDVLEEWDNEKDHYKLYYNRVSEDDLLDYNYWRYEERCGYINLFEEGCGHVIYLIIKGNQYGELVSTGNDNVIAFTNMIFVDFYLKWLDESIEKVEKVKKEGNYEETAKGNNW